jgi:hypothetical protein
MEHTLESNITQFRAPIKIEKVLYHKNKYTLFYMCIITYLIQIYFNNINPSDLNVKLSRWNFTDRHHMAGYADIENSVTRLCK